MADDTKAKGGDGSADTPGAHDPAGQSAQSATVRDAEAVLAKNKELNGENKALRAELRKFQEADAAREEAKKKDEGKYSELLTAKDAALQKSVDIIKRKEVALLMQRHGLQDPDYAAILMSRIEFNDDFEAQNAEEIFTSLRKDKPYLFGESAQKKAPAGTAPGVPLHQFKSGHVWTRAEIRRLMETPEGRKVYQENKAEIDRQWADPLSALNLNK